MRGRILGTERLPRMDTIFVQTRNGQNLLMYLAVSKVAINGVLMRLEKEKELPVYCVSKMLLDPKTCYNSVKKICLALIMVAGKLSPYF